VVGLVVGWVVKWWFGGWRWDGRFGEVVVAVVVASRGWCDGMYSLWSSLLLFFRFRLPA